MEEKWNPNRSSPMEEKKVRPVKERDTWSGKLDFFFSCVSYAVGLGNVWRFPYICYKNGGGAFFIPYILMVIFLAAPLMFLDFCLGQFCSLDCVKCWNFSPIFKGVGIAQVITLFLGSVTYTQVIAYSVYFLGASFSPEHPWNTCDAWWNTEGCRSKLPNAECSTNYTTRYENGSCYVNSTFIGLWDYRKFENVTGIRRILPSEEYFNKRVLHMTSGIEDLEGISWELVLALLGAWVLIYLPVIRGIKSAGKIAYVTAVFPYVIMTVLLVRGLTLPNSTTGIIYYLKPQWHRLTDAKVWYDAAVQVLYSYGCSCGLLNTLSCYNSFKKNIYANTLVVAVINGATSIFAGFVVFSFLGYLSHELEEPIEDVATSGSGLAFVLYPALVSRLPLPHIWAIIFFLMLICLGIDSMFVHVQLFMTICMDSFPWLRRHKPLLAFLMCLPPFGAGVILCSYSGMYVMYLLDTYSSGWILLASGILECVSISYVYGADRFCNDIRLMIGFRPSIWWRICWQFLAPLLLLFIFVFAIIDYGPPEYGSYLYPKRAQSVGWLISASILAWIPGVAIYEVCKQEGNIKQKIIAASLPSRDWGPAKLEHRKMVNYVPGFVVDPRTSYSNGELKEHNEKLISLKDYTFA